MGWLTLRSSSATPIVQKWEPYLEIYDRHFRVLRARKYAPRILQFGGGVGGDLAMWRWFFGPSARLYLVDPYNRTLDYSNNRSYGRPEHVFVGTATMPSLWREVRFQTGSSFDLIIHSSAASPEQQIACVEHGLPLLVGGGLVLVEEVTGNQNRFIQYVQQRYLWGGDATLFKPPTHPVMSMDPSSAQRITMGVYFYTFMVVIEKRRYERVRLAVMPRTVVQTVSAGRVPRPRVVPRD